MHLLILRILIYSLQINTKLTLRTNIYELLKNQSRLKVKVSNEKNSP